MTRRLFQHSTMMQNTSHVAVRDIRIDAAFFHHFQVVQREKAAVRTHLSRRLATLALYPVYHRHQQSVVIQFPADLLGHDQLIAALAAMRVESVATCPSSPSPSERASSTTCVKMSFIARPCRLRNSFSAQKSGCAPPAK